MKVTKLFRDLTSLMLFLMIGFFENSNQAIGFTAIKKKLPIKEIQACYTLLNVKTK
jgi:hypothetical protein